MHNFRPISVLEEEEKTSMAEKILKEKITENFPYFARDINVQIHGAEEIPNKINPKNQHQDSS